MNESDRAVLKRTLSRSQLFTLAFGSIIGVGWVVGVGGWIAGAGPLGAVIAFTAGMAVMLLVGLCYGELISLFPVSGGEVTYAYEIGGLRAAFLIGWFLAANYTTTCSFEMIAIPWIWNGLAPALSGPVLYEIFGKPVHASSLLLGLGITAAITFVNYRGVRETARLQSITTYTKVAVSLVFIVGAFGVGTPSNLQPLISVPANAPKELGAISGIVAIFAVAPFWFAGFDVVPQALGERRAGLNPSSVARLLLWAIVAAGVFYVLVILATAIALPRQVLLKLDRPAIQAFELALASPLMGKFVLLAALLGLITVWNATFFAATRILLSLGRVGAIPSLFRHIHPRNGTPHLSVLFVGVAGLGGGILGPGFIEPIVNAGGATLALIFGIFCFGVLWLRRTRPELQRQFRTPAAALVCPLSGIASFIMTYFALRHPTRVFGGWPLEWMLILGWLLLGFVVWRSARTERTVLTARQVRERLSQA